MSVLRYHIRAKQANLNQVVWSCWMMEFSL